jgi:hypothetical protein
MNAAPRIPTGASLSTFPSASSISAAAVVYEAGPTPATEQTTQSQEGPKKDASTGWVKKKMPPSMILEDDRTYKPRHNKKKKGKKVSPPIHPVEVCNANSLRASKSQRSMYGTQMSFMILYFPMIIMITKI